MIPFAIPSSINFHFSRPAAAPSSNTAPDAPSATPAEPATNRSLLSRIAGSALSGVKLSACCAVGVSLAGMGTSAAVLAGIGALAIGTAISLAEVHYARKGCEVPGAIVQHGVSNDWHTLAGGLAGATPTTMALCALASALAVTAADGTPELGVNSLACLAAMVAAPAMLLVGKSTRAIAGEPARPAISLACVAVPMITVGLALGLPSAVLHQRSSPEAALRFLVSFAANMAGATVREALTQTTLPAWRGIDRTGTGLEYGISDAGPQERLASTVVPTLISCLLFAGSSALTLHTLEAACDLGIAPAGQALLAQSLAETGRRSALRSLVLQSTNEMLEGLWRGLSLAAYAGARGIPLRCRNSEAGVGDIPEAMRSARRDPAAWDRTALFASARLLDGALPNLLAQLANLPGTTHYWNGFRIGAVIAQGATMARTPVLAAHVLPRLSGRMQKDAANVPREETTDSGAASLSELETSSVDSTPSSVVVESVDSTEELASSIATPCADPSLAWA